MKNLSSSGLSGVEWTRAAYDYSVDAAQRSVLFMDVLRKRGNLYFQHLKARQPPVLTFDYELILDGRTLERPVNYSLVRILNRRHPPLERQDTSVERRNNPVFRRGYPLERRRCPVERRGNNVKQTPQNHDQKNRPIVIIDPRAGHGPGIGGSKRDSEVGMALNNGHPVYFVIFYTDPIPGQTIADIQKAQVRFIEEVIRRHPQAAEPAVIGNCQAGWAAALVGADRPDVTGPLIFNGSPLSYWAGVEGKNPMRYRGGLLGGVWLTSFASDLGNGKFDGANLVAGFEDLNPANTLWTKQYNLYAKVDTEETRFLNFERWWSGYFLMASEEIHFIVDSLFIGNHLEKGNLELENDKWINLKNIEDPVVVFASSGDNITPPQQALNWIVKVYGSVEEIRRQQQVIVYLLHEEIGHLGIFVSGKVARKEHKAIIDSIDLIEYLPPGLYEMLIEEQDSQLGITDYRIRFQERRIQDILALDDGLQDEDPFETVAAVSQAGDLAYRTFLRPWIQFWTTELSAEILRQLHPLRVSRYIFSDRNPSVWPVKALTPMIKKQRRPVTADNPFLALEKVFSDSTEIGLNFYRDMRDICQEYWFKSVYDNPWMKTLFGDGAAKMNNRPETLEKQPKKEARDPDECLRAMEKGGFVAGLVRIILALAVADRSLDRAELAAAENIVLDYQPSKNIKRADYIKMVKEQSRILQTDLDQAIGTLPKLIKTAKDRQRAMAAARQVVFADKDLNPKEEAIWVWISKSLKVKS
jgi:pimeloyl-ACP methyl ester carboxylesterase